MPSLSVDSSSRDSAFKVSRYIVTLEPIEIDESNSVRIIYSTRSGRILTLPESTWDRVCRGELTHAPNEVLQQLFTYEILVPKTEDEFRTILEENKRGIADSDSLSMTLQPGAGCQLGCTYCGQEHKNTFMSADLQSSVIDHISRKIDNNPNYKTLSVTWYGGEPLLGLRKIRSMSEQLIAAATKRNLGYSAGIVTNGMLLTERVFNELATRHRVLSYQITVDGPADFHDKRRPTKSGKPTFDRIFGNIRAIAHSEVFQRVRCSISIRCNVDRNNACGIEELIDLAVAAELQGRVSFDLSPVVDWGENHASKQSLQKSEFARREIGWLRKLNNYGFDCRVIPTRKYGSCMIVDPESEVIDATGTIYPCWEMPYTSPYQDDNKYFIGQIGKAPTNRPAWGQNWHEQVDSETFGCKSCEFFPVCGGSCPKSWLQGTPACPSFKFNMADRLAMHILSQ